MPKDNAIQLNDSSNVGEFMDMKIDIQRDSEGKIVSGLSIGSTLEQNKALILTLSQGESKEYPTLGVGLADALLDDDLLGMRHAVRRSFAMDGLQITKLELYNTARITIEANY